MHSKDSIITFEIDGEAYETIRNEATSLSENAKTAIQAARGISGTTNRRFECTRDHARGCLEWRGTATRLQRVGELPKR